MPRADRAFRLGVVAGVASGVLLLRFTAAAAEPPEPARGEPAPATRRPTIEVFATTPLPAAGTADEEIPANVQSLGAKEEQAQRPADLGELLAGNAASVTVRSVQNNPFQNDVHYRGFQASPLLGTPIGVSVYLDGVRINEGFGDTLNFDLLPTAVLAGVDLVPGSNPVFGLNTLGGAISLRTKSGANDPGSGLEAWGGSFGRWAVEAEHGAQRGPLDVYLAIDRLGERGWRTESPSELLRLFGKAGYETETTRVDLSYLFADNELVGNGLVPERILDRRREAVYTFPDETAHRVHFVSLQPRHRLTPSLLLAGNAYLRDYERETLNGDVELDCLEASGEPDAVHPALCEGMLAPRGEERTTRTETFGFGGTLQLSHEAKLRGRANRLTAGVDYQDSDTHFAQSERDARLAATGLSVGIEGQGAFESEVDVGARQRSWGVYLTDTFGLTDSLDLVLSARYQHVLVALDDRTGEPENADLEGRHAFRRLSAGAGFTWAFSTWVSAFGGWSQSFRAPTPMELTCADPDDPCSLPNSFVADPPLDPIVGDTFEVGLRGGFPFGGALRWSAALYRTTLRDDLLFTVAETGSAGFFRNVSKTRRQGFELALAGSWRGWEAFVGYGYVDATFESSEVLASVVEPAGVPVGRGDRIPGIAAHSLTARLDWEVIPRRWSVGATLLYVSESFLRGDEANRLDPLDGYAVLQLRTRIQLTEWAELWGRLDNVTNGRYETAGARNLDAFAEPVREARFVGPGAPRAAWLGLRLRF